MTVQAGPKLGSQYRHRALRVVHGVREFIVDVDTSTIVCTCGQRFVGPKVDALIDRYADHRGPRMGGGARL